MHSSRLIENALALLFSFVYLVLSYTNIFLDLWAGKTANVLFKLDLVVLDPQSASTLQELAQKRPSVARLLYRSHAEHVSYVQNAKDGVLVFYTFFVRASPISKQDVGRSRAWEEPSAAQRASAATFYGRRGPPSQGGPYDVICDFYGVRSCRTTWTGTRCFTTRCVIESRSLLPSWRWSVDGCPRTCSTIFRTTPC